MPTPPEVDIDLSSFNADPYPMLAVLRRDAPVAFVPQLGSTLLTRLDDIAIWEKRIDVFSSHQPQGLMNRLMGHNMMRKDGAEHMAERKVFLKAVSQQAVKEVWTERFRTHALRILEELAPLGAADLMQAYALPLSGACLKELTGLTNVGHADIDAWSQAMIDGIANYVGDPRVEARCNLATAGIDAAIDDRLASVKRSPDRSLLSVMLEGGMPLENVRHNIKLTISGGQNEPRKGIAGAIWALLTHPHDLAEVRAGRLAWTQVFDEYVRWIAPIGMSPRRIAQAVAIHGATLAPESRAFLMFGSANRDEAHFEAADEFRPGRDTSKAIAFGSGPHFCAGTWAARALVANVALPLAFERLPSLQIDASEPIEITGWAFRGLRNLPVTWDVPWPQ
ncbi:MAG: cytochrome P450 [Hyphomicrobiaceae bacterium]|nr:cytochrome P450 [Hyphomicrobiaceae bacterium]